MNSSDNILVNFTVKLEEISAAFSLGMSSRTCIEAFFRNLIEKFSGNVFNNSFRILAEISSEIAVKIPSAKILSEMPLEISPALTSENRSEISSKFLELFF